ncbi:ADP-ribose pyrophosphatase YjhB (NUDIX family) [Actinoalloteichus hoggarensis]|uniref:Nucleoside triphosphatase NudI n=1 Tax=Actinoalloteichus hoggarensis TaxID=1470176 RepID=A0A221VZI7_9PSEU|nr:NUDIX domain-containing protein [Actinoalloteichus hoggarensis]ASO18927.1 Nucleoside triphosphatase NudI [Actinoalloteichus hoggarensis]MBB5920163.1 ADP-ribose pyrophosphatase YjhB (NUDIX family) [Actinoalloteichus hoggarensis]
MARTDYYQDPTAPQANSIVVAVTAVIQDETGRLLMIRRTDNDLYAIPGGAQDIGETISHTVVREVKEETGIDVEVQKITGIYTDPEHVIAYTDGEVRQEFSICFRAIPTGGELRTSNESKEVLWVEPDDLDALNIHPSIRLRITHGIERSGEPYFS